MPRYGTQRRWAAGGAGQRGRPRSSPPPTGPQPRSTPPQQATPARRRQRCRLRQRPALGPTTCCRPSRLRQAPPAAGTRETSPARRRCRRQEAGVRARSAAGWRAAKRSSRRTRSASPAPSPRGSPRQRPRPLRAPPWPPCPAQWPGRGRTAGACRQTSIRARLLPRASCWSLGARPRWLGLVRREPDSLGTAAARGKPRCRRWQARQRANVPAAQRSRFEGRKRNGRRWRARASRGRRRSPASGVPAERSLVQHA
mmetsp:Transcript_7238/g.29062  ORF Transcript_7238/g.29062 Transcript_7238/m.29062 type:complete len:256 (+) Transcript_7238:544-1311(+)